MSRMVKLDNGRSTSKVKYKRKKYGLDFSTSQGQLILFLRENKEYNTEIEVEGGRSTFLGLTTSKSLAKLYLKREGINASLNYKGETVWEAGKDFIEGHLYEFKLPESLPSTIVHEKWQKN